MDTIKQCKCGCEFFFVDRTDTMRGFVDQETGVLKTNKYYEEHTEIECYQCGEEYGAIDFKDIVDVW